MTTTTKVIMKRFIHYLVSETDIQQMNGECNYGVEKEFDATNNLLTTRSDQIICQPPR
jgi:hypothetical protein